jgi:hypothetical protein
MPKKISKDQEKAFIEYFCEGSTAGNATKSAEKCGYKHNTRQMGSYLKNKLQGEIRLFNEQRIASSSGMAINVLQDLLVHSEQDSVKMNVAKLLLELGNYSQSTVNLNVDNIANKTDDELIAELQALIKDMPHLSPKLSVLRTIESKEDNEILPSQQSDNEDLTKH